MLVHPQFDPVALSLGPLQIHWYGLTYLAAFGLFLFLAARRVRLPHFAAAGWARRDVEDMLFFGVLIFSGILRAIFARSGISSTACVTGEPPSCSPPTTWTRPSTWPTRCRS